MATFKVAHIREQGVDSILELQACATAAGLAGGIVPVWGP